MTIYYIGVGSSHPNGAHYIDKAYELLEYSESIQTLAKSPNYPNPAFGGQTLFGFINAAFKIKTQLHPNALWFLLLSVEIKLGRVRQIKNGPRTLDLDILWSSAGPIQTLSARGVAGLSTMMKYHAERAPLKRNVEPREVGETGLFLCSSLSSGITGQVIYVDCGFNIMGI